MNRLLARRRHVLTQLPALEEILRGSILDRTVRCGGPGCHCAGGDGHPVTTLTVSFAGGRTSQLSLPARLVPVAKRWVANYHAWWTIMEEVSAINREILRQQRRQAGTAEPRIDRRRRGRRRGGSGGGRQ
jgi:hypothetical protein